MAEATATGAMSATRETFDKSIHVIVDIFAPIGAGLAGIFMPSVLGGGQSVANAFYRTVDQNSGSGNMANRAGWGIQGLINAAIGAAFWSLRGHSNIIANVIGNVVGGFFFGGAIGCIPGVISGGTQPPNGLIDKLVSGVQNVAAGG